MAFYYDSHIVPDAAWHPAQDAGCAGRLKNLHFAGRIRQTGEALIRVPPVGPFPYTHGDCTHDQTILQPKPQPNSRLNKLANKLATEQTSN